MSKKDKRIKDLERTLRASVARNAIVARKNRELWVAYEAVRFERDSLRHDLGECQAGREALQRYIDDLAPVAVWKAHAKETAAYADELQDENAELKSKIKAITTAAVDWAEHGSALIAELLDGDEG